MGPIPRRFLFFLSCPLYGRWVIGQNTSSYSNGTQNTSAWPKILPLFLPPYQEFFSRGKLVQCIIFPAALPALEDQDRIGLSLGRAGGMRGVGHEIKTIGVIGAGQMGRGIVEVASGAGFKVRLHDASQKALDMGLDFIKKRLERGVQKRKWGESFLRETLGRVTCVDKLGDLSPSDLIVEAIVEDKETKCTLFRELDTIVAPRCILASNTSSISIGEMAVQTQYPGRVVGMHFMNPVPAMKLVEGIRGPRTEERVFSAVRETAENMGKVFIEVKDGPGFAVNRILMPTINEAIHALQEGVASAEDIDRAMVLGASWPMGPLKLADFIGLDTCLAIMCVLHEGLGEDKYRPCSLLEEFVAQGRLGKKSKRGFYAYGE